MSYVRHLKRPAQILQAFGVKKGTLAYSSYVRDHLIHSARAQPRKIEVRGASHPIWLRPGTSDWLVMEQTFLSREYDFSHWPDHERGFNAYYRRQLEQSRRPVIVDCGANIGLSSVWFAEKFPEAHVLAVEPEPENFNILVQNSLAYPNIKPIHAAVSDHVGQVSLENADGAPWAWRTTEALDGEIETVTVPSLWEHDPRSAPMIVKINIEGAEAELFRSNNAWVRQSPLIIIELHDWLIPWKGAGHAVFSALTQHQRDYLPHGKIMFSFSHACRTEEEHA